MKLWFRLPVTGSGDRGGARRRRSLLLAVIGIVVLPLAWHGPSCGQDFDFHLQNWLEVVHHWRYGILWPHWAASANYLAGEPRFVFYPPLSWILGGVLGLVLPWSWTPVAYVLLCLLGAGFSTRAFAREWMSEDSATLAACLYVVNPYMLFVIYDRSAQAELLAATWIPLLLLFALRASRPESRDRSTILPLALTFAALWLTNAPAAVMGSYMLALVVLVAAIQQKSWRLVGRSAAAVVLGLGLAGFWLIPAIREQAWVQIDQAIGPLMRVEDSFLFGFVPLATASPDDRFDILYHNSILRTVSWIAVALMAAALPGAWLSRRHRSPLWAPLVVVGLAVAALQFRFTDFLWRAVPELKFLQFPWRWLVVLALVCALLIALAVRREPTTRRRIAGRAAVLLSIAAGMAVLSAFLFWQPCDEEDNIAAQRAAFQTTGFEGSDEYTLKGVDESTLAAPGDSGSVSCASCGPVVEVVAANPDRPGLNQTRIPATEKSLAWTPERLSVLVTAQSNGFAVLRLTDYPAWRILLNGTEVARHTHRPDGFLVVPVRAGLNQIDIRWRITPDQEGGIVLSLAALAITLALVLAARGRPRKVPLP